MLGKVSIATRLAIAASLFLAPVAYGLWIQVEVKTEQIAFAGREAAGVAYLRGIDAVQGALERALILRQPADNGALVAALAELRARHGAAMESEGLSQEAEALVLNKDRSAMKEDARRALRRLVQHVANRAGIVLDPEIATLFLGDIFSSRLVDLREQLVEVRKAGGAAGSLDTGLLSGRIETLMEAVDDGLAMVVGPQGSPPLKDTLDAAFQPYSLMMGHALAMLGTGTPDPAILTGAIDAVNHFTETTSGQFAALVEARIERLDRERLRTVAIGGVLFLAALAAVVALVRLGVIAPLRQMTGALRRLADGDIEAPVPGTRFDDEIAELGDAMRRFKQALGDSRSLSRSVVDSTMQVSVATEQAAIAIAQVSDGARHQMASVDRLRLAFEETLEAMNEVVGVTLAGQERSRLSSDRLAESLADIDALAEAVREIATMSNEINRVTASIGKLAAHSNILSLNASIEASRAGEHGRGFSVVAAAVGALARQTLELAQEIAALARRSNERIGRGLEVGVAVGRRMQEVSQSITDTDRLSQTIVDDVARQQQTFGRVEKALLELAEISHANASASEEIAATMRGLAALTDDTRRRAEGVLADEA